MMHRRGGKRIRMDDPVPPEYETPMTPMTPMTDDRGDANDSYNAYTPYNQASQTPLHNPTYILLYIIIHLPLLYDMNVLLDI